MRHTLSVYEQSVLDELRRASDCVVNAILTTEPEARKRLSDSAFSVRQGALQMMTRGSLYKKPKIVQALRLFDILLRRFNEQDQS